MTTAETIEDVGATPPSAFRKTQWGMVWLLTLVLFSALTVGGLLAPLQEAAKADLGMNDQELILIVGTASAVPVALLAVPLAWMVDHYTRKWLLIAMASLWAIGTIGTAYADGFLGLFVARFIAGLGAGTAFPVVVSLLADVCMPERRGRAMVLLSMGAWGGAAAAFALGGSLFGWLEANPAFFVPDMTAWRETHLVVGLASAILILPLFLMREPARHEVERTDTRIMPALMAFWRRKNFLGPLFVGNFAGGLAEGAAALWLGSVLIRQFDLQPGDFGWWVGLVILGSGIVGSIIGGFASDYGQKLKMRGGILLPAVIATALSIPASAYPLMPTVHGFAWVLFALLAGGTIINLVNSAAIAVLIPNEERATSLAALKLVSTFVGGIVVPPILVLMTSLMDGPSGLGMALTWLGVITGVISLIGYWFAMAWAPPAFAEVEAERSSGPVSGAGIEPAI